MGKSRIRAGLLMYRLRGIGRNVRPVPTTRNAIKPKSSPAMIQRWAGVTACDFLVCKPVLPR
jgi:hypothetical protein